MQLDRFKGSRETQQDAKGEFHACVNYYLRDLSLVSYTTRLEADRRQQCYRDPAQGPSSTGIQLSVHF